MRAAEAFGWAGSGCVAPAAGKEHERDRRRGEHAPRWPTAFHADASARPEQGVVIVTPAIEPATSLVYEDHQTPTSGATRVYVEPQGEVLRTFVWSPERSRGGEIVEGFERTLGMHRVGAREP